MAVFPLNILIMGKDATQALGEKSARAGRSWGIGVLQSGPLWMFPLPWRSATIFRLNGLYSVWAQSWISLSAVQELTSFNVSYQAPCTNSSCGLSFQEEVQTGDPVFGFALHCQTRISCHYVESLKTLIASLKPPSPPKAFCCS